MSDSDSDERALQIARLEVKVDSILEHLRTDRETMKERFEDHENRLRKMESLGDPEKLLRDSQERLDKLDAHAKRTDRWVHSIPVGVAVAFIIAVGALVSYVNGITPA